MIVKALAVVGTLTITGFCGLIVWAAYEIRKLRLWE